ncbi:MAG: DEAD/DEAH box helicase [Rhodothalassiaceae bacterium]
MTTFSALGLSPDLARTIAALGYADATPIQTQAIPLVLDGRDLMGLAQTGTGKTAAFGLPLIDQLIGQNTRPSPKGVRALVLAPTRELVNQIAANLKAFARGQGLRIGTVVGGAPIGPQIRGLAPGLDVLVATPGRLLDLADRRAVSLADVRFLVLDEADHMLDLGFIHALKKIVALLGTGPRQTLLFSATMPTAMADLAKAYLHDPVRVEAAAPGRAADRIRQSVHVVEQKGKTDLLKTSLGERDGRAIVFARTKHGADRIAKDLATAGFDAGAIHGNKSQSQRERTLKAFRSGRVRVLVATDVAARGIDVPGVETVYNFDLPEVAENYVHRIGRTARAGAAGEAIAFCTPNDVGLLRAVEKLMGLNIPVASGTLPQLARPKRAGKAGQPRSRAKRPGGPKRGGRPAGGRAARGHGQTGGARAAR